MDSMKTQAYLLVALALSLSSCAALHKVQLSDIDGRTSKGRPVSVRISETTVDLREVASISKSLGRASHSKGLNSLGKGFETYTMLFQFGPRTGAPVYNEFYARDLPERLVAECPQGRLTNLISVRESREYPVIKGEILRVDGICVSK